MQDLAGQDYDGDFFGSGSFPSARLLTDLEKPSDQILGKGVASPLRLSGVLIGSPIFWRWTAILLGVFFCLRFIRTTSVEKGREKKKKGPQPLAGNNQSLALVRSNKMAI